MFVIELLNWENFGNNLFHFSGPYEKYEDAEKHCRILNHYARNGARWTIRRRYA